jgi:hypothetical protein
LALCCCCQESYSGDSGILCEPSTCVASFCCSCSSLVLSPAWRPSLPVLPCGNMRSIAHLRLARAQSPKRAHRPSRCPRRAPFAPQHHDVPSAIVLPPREWFGSMLAGVGIAATVGLTLLWPSVGRVVTAQKQCAQRLAKPLSSLPKISRPTIKRRRPLRLSCRSSLCTS